MHSTLWLCSAAEWKEFSCSVQLFSHSAPQPTHSLVGVLTVRWQASPTDKQRGGHPSAAEIVDRWVLEEQQRRVWAPVWQCSHARLREEEQDSCAAWTSIGSGYWKCVERRLHHRCYLLILVCKSSNYPVTAATCTKLDTSLLAPLCCLPSFLFLLLHCLLFCKNVALWSLIFYVQTEKKKPLLNIPCGRSSYACLCSPPPPSLVSCVTFNAAMSRFSQSCLQKSLWSWTLQLHSF